MKRNFGCAQSTYPKANKHYDLVVGSSSRMYVDGGSVTPALGQVKRSQLHGCIQRRLCLYDITYRSSLWQSQTSSCHVGQGSAVLVGIALSSPSHLLRYPSRAKSTPRKHLHASVIGSFSPELYYFSRPLLEPRPTSIERVRVTRYRSGREAIERALAAMGGRMEKRGRREKKAKRAPPALLSAVSMCRRRRRVSSMPIRAPRKPAAAAASANPLA